jgi:hypothetical protein
MTRSIASKNVPGETAKFFFTPRPLVGSALIPGREQQLPDLFSGTSAHMIEKAIRLDTQG